MTVGGENFGGRGRIALLSCIATSGSITRAAKAMKMSYKAAWDAIDTMNNLAGEPLVERVVGGKGGGGTRLTARAERLVANFELIEREHRRLVEQLNQQTNDITTDLLLIRSMNMKTSARNQFLGTVTKVVRGAVNDEVELEIAGGHRLVAIVTHDSAQELGLQVGAAAIALVKASSVIVVTEPAKARFSARNQLSGTISRVHPGAVNTELVIELPGGGTVAAIVTVQSSHTLDLAVGKPVSAIFKASSVILGVAT